MMQRNLSNVLQLESGSGSRKQKSWKKRTLVKLLLMVITSIAVLHFQINRPKVTDTYSTRDPLDTVRQGVHYTCGCTLPPSLHAPENSPLVNASADSHSTLNRCYEGSELETVKILMYSNSTGAKVEEILNYTHSDQTYPSKKIPGSYVMSEAHSVSWSNKSVSDTFKSKLQQELYVGGYRQPELAVPHQQLQDGRTYPDFPTSYVGMSFVFLCHDCTSCPLEKVNQIFHSISSSAGNQNWGDCNYWGRENQCSKRYNYYEAKCQMYPTVGIPFMFAIQRFLGDFQRMGGVSEIGPPWDTVRQGNASFDANVLYMNLSRIQSDDVELRFSEVEKGSSAWLQLVNLFPALDTECSDLKMTEICRGTSLCNVYQGGVQTRKPLLGCLDMAERAKCLYYMNDTTGGSVTLEDHSNLWIEFELYIKLDGEVSPKKQYHPSRSDWLNLMCMDPGVDHRCELQPPYLVQRETSMAMRGSSFNQFLESEILSDSWAQASGVCTKTYEKVFKSARTGGNPTNDGPTMYLEANCSQNSSGSMSTGKSNGYYCWLTGRYRQLTDIPTSGDANSAWHQLDGSWNSTHGDLFWCYNVKEQRFVYWFIITFGVLFGWLGTIDLVWKWLAVLLARVPSLSHQTSNKYHDENKPESILKEY